MFIEYMYLSKKKYNSMYNKLDLNLDKYIHVCLLMCVILLTE